jgi:hypothetical protein
MINNKIFYRSLCIILTMSFMACGEEDTNEDVSAGTTADIMAGTNAGTQANTEAGTTADAGMMAGTTVNAGMMAGTDAGTEAGMMSGTQAGTQAGTEVNLNSVPITAHYTDDYDTSHVIDSIQWEITYPETQPNLFIISSVNQEAMYLIAQNAESNEFDSELWSRFDWHVDDLGGIWYCQTTYNAVSAQAAEDSMVADHTQVDQSGCGSFPWTQLYLVNNQPEEIFPLNGSYQDDYNTQYEMSNDQISMQFEDSDASLFAIYYVNFDHEFVIAQNGVDNEFFPNIWSRFDWLTDEQGKLWYCQSAYNAISAEVAVQSQVDRSTVTTGGCGDFPWTLLSNN